jgi:hypothetical protein
VRCVVGLEISLAAITSSISVRSKSRWCPRRDRGRQQCYQRIRLPVKPKISLTYSTETLVEFSCGGGSVGSVGSVGSSMMAMVAGNTESYVTHKHGNAQGRR